MKTMIDVLHKQVSLPVAFVTLRHQAAVIDSVNKEWPEFSSALPAVIMRQLPPSDPKADSYQSERFKLLRTESEVWSRVRGYRTKEITIPFWPAQWQELKALAKQVGVPVGWLLRAAIDRAIEARRKAKAERARLRAMVA